MTLCQQWRQRCGCPDPVREFVERVGLPVGGFNRVHYTMHDIGELRASTDELGEVNVEGAHWRPPNWGHRPPFHQRYVTAPPRYVTRLACRDIVFGAAR